MRWLRLPLLVCGAPLSTEGPRAASFEPNAGDRRIEWSGWKLCSALPPAQRGRRFCKVPARPPLACGIRFLLFEGKIT